MANSFNSDNYAFDYENVKSIYTYEMSEYYESTTFVGPWTKMKRDKYIKCIKYQSNLTKNMKYYSIVQQNGKDILVLKENTNIEVLPWEECFDILVDLHVSKGHIEKNEMLKTLLPRYIFKRICLNVFLKNCNVCVKYNKCNMNILNSNKINEKNAHDTVNDITDENNFVHGIVLVKVLKLDISDEQFKYILICCIKKGGFLILRPLNDIDVTETAFEFHKIFSDFGPPETIHTPHEDFISKALQILNDVSPCHINVVQKDVLKAKTLQVQRKLRSWVKNNNLTHWALGCHIVQARLNRGVARGFLGTEFLHETLFDESEEEESDSCDSDLNSSGGGESDEEICVKASTDLDLTSLCSEINSQLTETATDAIHELPVISVMCDSAEIPSTSARSFRVIDCVACKKPVYNKKHCKYCSDPLHDFCSLRLVIQNNTSQCKTRCPNCAKMRV